MAKYSIFKGLQILLRKNPGFLEKYGTNGSEQMPQKTTKKAQKTRKVNDSRIQTLQKEFNKLFREINKGNDEV